MEGLFTSSGVGVGVAVVGNHVLHGPRPTRPPSGRRSFYFSFTFLRRVRSFGDFAVHASREKPELDKWDQMELEFGRLLGEDPNLTIAKIMARKSNPDASYLDVEKDFVKRKGKRNDDILSSTVDMNVERRLPNSPPILDQAEKKAPNISRAEILNLSRPILNKGMKAVKPVARPAAVESQQYQLPGKNDVAGGFPNLPSIALRKPATIQDEDIENDKQSRLKIKPNLSLKMRKDTCEGISDVTLLKKPEIVRISSDIDQKNMSSSGSTLSHSSKMGSSNDISLLRPNVVSDGEVEITDEAGTDKGGVLQQNSLNGSAVQGMMDGGSYVIGDNNTDSVLEISEVDSGLDKGLQPPKQREVKSKEVEVSPEPFDQNKENHTDDVFNQAALLGKPERMDPSQEAPHPGKTESLSLNFSGYNHVSDTEYFRSAEPEEHEENDWKRAENLVQTGERVEVELVSCSSRGFVVSFHSLVGFLPYRNVGAKWKFLAFESWLRQKGLDPNLYRQKPSTLGSYDVQTVNIASESSTGQGMICNDAEILPPNLKFEDLLAEYDEEKTKFLSSFIGQRVRVSAILADRNSRRLLFSGRPKEKEEVLEKRRNLMAKLSIGDVVKCTITKITYFGIFVEVEGVPALIHQSEVSWDAALDPSSFYKIGQMLDAKVHQLDYILERITLSLKDLTPNPLMEALESVVGDSTSLGGKLKVAQADVEWPDVDSLIKELQSIDGVHSVSKGRFFMSPGLAPTFQVYMASMFDNQYKLLARYGNKVQEVLVQASLDKEQMKGEILTCTNRVE